MLGKDLGPPPKKQTDNMWVAETRPDPEGWSRVY